MSFEVMRFTQSHWILILVILTIIGGAFYWYEYRPSAIRRECNEYADLRSRNGDFNNRERYEFRYNFCLSQKGLK
jgi:hypothetical protein